MIKKKGLSVKREKISKMPVESYPDVQGISIDPS